MIKKIQIFFLLTFMFSFAAKADSDFPLYGKKDAKIKIKVFSSLTCPYCAEFHNKILPNIKKKYVLTEKVSIELLDFPLDLAGLKAAQVQKCLIPENQKIYLDKIYLTQSKWTSAKTLKELEANLENITKELGLNGDEFQKCLKNKKHEETVLQSRINAQTKYEIKSTPTFVINEKKFKGSINDLEKHIKKLL